MRTLNIYLRIALCACLLAGSVSGLWAQEKKYAVPVGLEAAIKEFRAKVEKSDMEISRSVDRKNSPETGRLVSFITVDRFKLAAEKKKSLLTPLVNTFMDNAERAYFSKTISSDTPDDAESVSVSIDDAGNSWQFPSRRGKTIVCLSFVNSDDPDKRDFYLLRWFADPDDAAIIQGQVYHILSKRPDVLEKERKLAEKISHLWLNSSRKDKLNIVREAMKDNLPPESVQENIAGSFGQALPEQIVRYLAKYLVE